jgi:DNA replication protein DnaC
MSDPCPTCGGTGFELRTAEGGVSTAVRCACSYRERGAQLLQAARIPRRYDHCRFDNFELYDPGLKQPLAVAREWFERWPDRVEHGLLFWGSPGGGKTHLAAALLRELAERKGARVVFAEQREFLKELQGTFDGGGGRSESDVLAPVVDAEVLLLDDLGAGRTTAWAQDVMHDVLAHRYNRRLPTLMTTNRATGDEPDVAGNVPSLRDRLGDALMSRLYEMCLLVPVAAKTDYRRSMLHAQHRF